MNIILKKDNNISNVEFGKLNLILGKNNSGKTSILNLLNKALLGDIENTTINGLKPSKSTFNIIFIEEDRNLEEEVGLKSKSTFYKKKLMTYYMEQEEEFDKITSEYIFKMKELFENEKFQYKYKLSNSKLTINHEKIEKLNNILFNLDFDFKSMSSKEEFYIRQKIQPIANNKYTFILIDDLDRYLDYEIINTILNNICNMEKTSLICTSNKKAILYDCSFSSIHNTNLEKINIMEEAKLSIFKEYIKKENTSKTLDDYIMENEYLFTDEDFKSFFQKNKEKVINQLKF